MILISRCRVLAAAFVAGLAAVLVGACSPIAQPGYFTYVGEPATVSTIEMLWPNGDGMGAFVESTVLSNSAGAETALRYRVTIQFDGGQRTSVVQGATPHMTLGDRVMLRDGQLVPTTAADPVSNTQRTVF
jgi:hypothetical protein